MAKGSRLPHDLVRNRTIRLRRNSSPSKKLLYEKTERKIVVRIVLPSGGQKDRPPEDAGLQQLNVEM